MKNSSTGEIFNPLFLAKALKSYIFDLNRLWDLNEERLHHYQENKIKRLVEYSYKNIPFYRRKYQEVGLHPTDIETLDDVKDLPFVTKDELRKCSIKELTLRRNRKFIKTSTSGTMGRPVSIYLNMYDILIGLLGYLRTLKEHGIDWSRDRIALIVDLRRNSAERKYLNEGIIPGFKPFISFRNIRIYSFKVDSQKLIRELNKFQPDFIGGYTGKLVNLALLKEDGFGKNITPKVIASSGNTLDKYLRALIEEAFDTRLFEAYGATESGPIAFECRKGKMHVQEDLVYTEFIHNGKLVTDKPGNIVVTKLYGEVTPIIRYSGINDVVEPSKEKCNCGLGGKLIKKIYGRDNWYLVFSNGRVMLPSTVSEIFSKAVYKFKTRMIRQFEIIQNSLNEIEVRVVIDKKLREDSLTRKVFSIIKSGFYEKVDSSLDIKIKEVNKIESGKYLTSKLDKNKFENITYI